MIWQEKGICLIDAYIITCRPSQSHAQLLPTLQMREQNGFLLRTIDEDHQTYGQTTNIVLVGILLTLFLRTFWQLS